jgi:RimJ/RimL family protein N-acetyltransferase
VPAIPILLGGAPVASLQPLTMACLDDAGLLAQLTGWRNAARSAFLTQFEATAPRTRAWLERVVLPDPTRRLYTIDDAEGPLGTIGFMHLSDRSAELDNLIRGVRRGPPALIRAAEAALVSWLFDTHGLAQIEAVVLAGNFSALQLHQSLGFQVTRRVPLRRTEQNGEIALIESDAESQIPDDNGLAKLLLVLNREDFTP